MKEMNTVGDVLDLLDEMSRMGDEMKAHAETLRGPRTRGSTTELGLEDAWRGTLLTELKSDAVLAECRAFTFEASVLRGKLGATSLARVMHEPAAWGGYPKIRDGAHGQELFIDVPPEEGRLIRASQMTVILGDHNGWEVIYTWHPGMPLLPFSGEIRGGVAVKLHNGE